MKVKKHRGVEQLQSRTGRLFVLPWEIGLVLFFFVPLIKSIYYSFCDVGITNTGIKTTWVGLKWYDFIINQHPDYLESIRDMLSAFAVQLPIILALSLILAMVLNQKFRGRMFARAIFFLPVIIATGVIMNLMTGEHIQVSLVASSGSQGNYGTMIDFDAILGNLGLPEEITTLIASYIGDVFNLLWSCGIQIVLFIAGLQSIPDQLYEVSKVEGASKWEEFWYITVPMLGPTILLVMVYTMIDLFTQNQFVIATAFDLMSNQAIYDQSSAMVWFYFVVVGAVMALVIGVYNFFCLRRWN